MKILIFDDTICGHHLEYLHHIYERALELPEREFVFAVPHEFKSVSSKMMWEKASNISFLFIDNNKAKTPYSRSRLLGQLVKDTKAEEVLLISLMSFLPWLPLFVSPKIRVSGIVYLIYLYRWKTASWKARILDVLKYLLFSKCRVFHRVFLLNDKVSPRYLNWKFKTKKFGWLPDPVAIEEDLPSSNLRKELGLSQTTKVFSHFGALAKRKGTLEILKALVYEDCGTNDLTCVFAGRVGQDIRVEFYNLLAKAKARGKNISVFDTFCSYSFLTELSRESLSILIPYTNTEQSSGVIAYAAKTGTPVFCPSGGLLGRLVKRYGLGTTSERVSPKEIASYLKKGEWERVKDTSYLTENSLASFKKIILS